MESTKPNRVDSLYFFWTASSTGFDRCSLPIDVSAENSGGFCRFFSFFFCFFWRGGRGRGVGSCQPIGVGEMATGATYAASIRSAGATNNLSVPATPSLNK